MKPKSTLRHSLLLAAGSLLLAVSSASAADGTWDEDANGLWSTSTNWASDTIADLSGFTAYFTNDITADRTVSLDSDRTLTNLVFGDSNTATAGSWILDNNGVSTNNLILAGTTPTITVNALGTGKTATISAIIEGSAGLGKSGSGTLTLSGGNTYTGGTTINAGTLQIGAGGTTGTLGSGTVLNDSALSFNRSNQISVSNVISGGGSVSNNGGGILELLGNNTYGGGTFVNAGTLLLRADTGGRVGSGTVTVASGGGTNFLIWAPSAVTLTNNIVLNGATGVDNRAALNHDGGGGKVTLSGTVTLNATSDIGIGGGSSNDMDITGVVSGVGGIIVDEKNVGGTNRTLTLAGANTYTGPTSVTGGTLKAGIASVANVSGAFGKNSAVTLANTSGVNLDITGFNTQIGSLTGGGASGGNVTLGSGGSSRTLTVGGDNTSPAAYAGVISGGGGVTKIGSGTQIFSGTNTYTGATTVSAGTLTFAGSSSGTLGAINVGGSGTTQLNIQAGSHTQGAGGFFVGTGGDAGIVNHTGGTLTWNSNGLQLLIGNGGFNGTYNLSGGSVTTVTGVTTRGVMLGVNAGSSATFNLSGTGALNVAGTSRLMIGRSDAASSGTTNLFSQTGGTATISNLTIGGPAGGASGANSTLSLSGGTFTATAFLLLSNGTNDISTINIGGTAVVTLPNLPTARGSGATATMNFDGGTLKNSATGTFISGLTNAFIKAGGAKFDTSLNSTTISQNLLTHGSSTGGGLTKIGTNTLTLSGTNTYTGGTTVSAGTLTMGNASALGSTSGHLTVNGGTLDMAGHSLTVGNLTGTGGVISGTSGARTLTIGQGNTGGGNYQGAINNGAGGTTALTKTGSGTITLSGANTYTGTTTVAAGVLVSGGSGTINTSSGITVDPGGTLRYNSTTALTVAPTLDGAGTSNRAVLGGTGTINAEVTLDNVGDVLSPGNSPGIQTYTPAQTWASFSYDWEINNFAGTTAGTHFDQIVAGSSLDFTGSTGAYVLNVLGLTAGNAPGLVPNFGEINRSWTILTSSGTLSGFHAGNWTVNTAGFTDPDTGTWALDQSGNNLVLSYTIIPEPRAALLGGLGLLALLRRRRD